MQFENSGSDLGHFRAILRALGPTLTILGLFCGLYAQFWGYFEGSEFDFGQEDVFVSFYVYIGSASLDLAILKALGLI